MAGSDGNAVVASTRDTTNDLVAGELGVIGPGATSASVAAHLADTTSAHAAASVDAVARLGGGKEAVTALAATGSTETLDISSSNVITAAQDASCTYTMPSGLTSGVAISFSLVITSGGAYTATFTGVKWAAGTAPTLTSGAGKVDIFTFLTLDGGTTWYGSVLADVR